MFGKKPPAKAKSDKMPGKFPMKKGGDAKGMDKAMMAKKGKKKM